MTLSESVQHALKTRREIVNEAIDDQLPIKKPEDLYTASRYLLDAGGKRLRPTILLLGAEAVSNVPPLEAEYRAFPGLHDRDVDVLSAAVSIEIIQSFTLIHDDIMDDDELRRGVPAVHEAFDIETAILAGDTLYSKAFEYMLQTNASAPETVQALDALATTCTEICEGQALDIAFESRQDVTIDEYLEMIEYKTAVLYAAAASIPAILLGADEDIIDGLYNYGLAIGRAFQIQDDLLDLTTPSKTLGKRRGSDLIEGKRTIITLHARSQGVSIDELVPKEPDEADIAAAVNQLDAVGSLDYARTIADEYVEDGIAQLEVLESSQSRALLEEIATFLVERTH